MSTQYRNVIFKYRFFLFIAQSQYSALLYSKSRGFLNQTQKPQLDDNGPSLITSSFSSLSGSTPIQGRWPPFLSLENVVVISTPLDLPMLYSESSSVPPNHMTNTVTTV